MPKVWPDPVKDDPVKDEVGRSYGIQAIAEFGGFDTISEQSATRRSERSQSLPLNAHFWSKCELTHLLASRFQSPGRVALTVSAYMLG